MREIIKLESTLLSDCRLHTVIVCADCDGMMGSVKEILRYGAGYHDGECI